MSKKLITGKILAIQLGRNETQIALVGKNAEILHGITVGTPMGAVEDGMIHDQEAITAMLKEALLTPEFKGVRQVVFSLCTSQVIMETATTPDLPKAKLEKLIQANADMYFPVDIRDYRLVWEVVDVKKNDAGTKEASVQLWAVPNEMLRGYYQTANACGLSVTAIDYCGHSAATAVGATFARPAKPPKAKAPKDPEAPKEPKPKKIDWNAEITFGKKKKVEPEIPQEETGPRVVPATDMHILMDAELLGLTFVQEGQVVYQRFYRCGADPSYQFSELAMMVEYFQTQEIGRGSEISGYVSGPGSANADMVDLLSGMLAIPLASFQAGQDPRWLLCTGAVRTNLEFGNPSFNTTVRVRRQINTDLWQYAAILASGAVLVTVVLMLLNARLGWNTEVSSLENEYTILSGQAAKVNGFKENYESYLTAYEAYDRDWEALFDSLHTYNDNLVFVLKELENVMPENTSVTDIVIDSDNVMISFACDDKEEAAYLIMSLRDMEYVDVNTISNLIGGGKGAATEYGTPIEEVTPPTEGGSEDEHPSRNELRVLYENYGQTEDGTPYISVKSEHLSYIDFLNKHEITEADRQNAVRELLGTNPFAIDPFLALMKQDMDNNGALYNYITGHPDGLAVMQGANKIYKDSDMSGVDDTMAKAIRIITESAIIADTEDLLLNDNYLSVAYLHYLEAVKGQWGEIPKAEGDYWYTGYCPYLNTTPENIDQTMAGGGWLYGKTQGDSVPHEYFFCNMCCEHGNGYGNPEATEEGHRYTCSLCGYYYDEPGNCADTAPRDRKCDICDDPVECDHSVEERKYEQNSDGLSHKVLCAADDCGVVVEEKAACKDDGNGKCADCTGKIASCKHDLTEPKLNGDGTHSYTCVCGQETGEPETCVDKNPEDETCDICKGPVPKPVVAPLTRADIEKLEEYYGKTMNDESLEVFVKNNNPNFYQKKAALINMFTTDAFAINNVYDSVSPIAQMYKYTKWNEATTFPEMRNNMGSLIQLVAGEANESYLAMLENQLFSGSGNESNDGKYNLETAYVYFLKVAMGKEKAKAGEYPHLLENPRTEIPTPEAEYVERALKYVKDMWDEEIGSIEQPDNDYVRMMSQYLRGSSKDYVEGVDNDTLAELNKYFSNESSLLKTTFDNIIADKVTNEGKAIRDLLKYEFYYKYYQESDTMGKNARSLIDAYVNGQMEGGHENQVLLLALQQLDKEAQVLKDNLQDDQIAEHEKEIEDLKKQLESLKKAASDKEKEAEGAAGGSGAVKGDTRVFLDIGLLYTEELWNQELQRKGLDRTAKVPRLELEVAG